jgi:hypothetical protein
VDLYDWVVFGHVIAAILGLGAHGVSAFVMFRVRSENDRSRLAAILDLSSGTLAAMGILLIVAIVLGIVAAIMGGHFSKFWPWASIIVIVVVGGTMTPLAGTPLTRVRKALGMKVYGDKPADPPRVPGSDEELALALAGVRPAIPTAMGIGAIVILVWLMHAKPF